MPPPAFRCVEAADGIADRQVRSLGTIGGGLSVADPSGGLPACLRGLGASVVITGGSGEPERVRG